MGNNPSYLKGEDLPVDQVSWYDAVKYCNRLSIKNGLNPCYEISSNNVLCDFSKTGFRLPTEAEWEYAARGGTRSEGYFYSGSNRLNSVGWDWDLGNADPHPVAQKQPNELGLFDMTGNVWEWCWDWYGPYSSSSQTDPKGPSFNKYRIVRGGGVSPYKINPSPTTRDTDMHVYHRKWTLPEDKSRICGFRLASSAP